MEKQYFNRFKSGWVRINGKCYEIHSSALDGLLNCYLLNKQGRRETMSLTKIDLNTIPLHEIVEIGKQPSWE